MKRASTRFWLCVSVCAFGVACFARPPQAQAPKSYLSGKKIEVQLAGVHPGVTSLRSARVIISAVQTPPQILDAFQNKDETISWGTCSDKELTLDVDKKGVVQSVRVRSQEPSPECFVPTGAKIKWATGRGLRLGDSAKRAVELYGEPDSRSPSTKNGQPLELLYYAFDWAGPDVPQVMEVVCTAEKDGKPGRVVEITLAAGSL